MFSTSRITKHQGSNDIVVRYKSKATLLNHHQSPGQMLQIVREKLATVKNKIGSCHGSVGFTVVMVKGVVSCQGKENLPVVLTKGNWQLSWQCGLHSCHGKGSCQLSW